MPAFYLLVPMVKVLYKININFCRVQAEQERLERIGPIAYYSEWVKAWKRDTSREAVQKHFEETGEDENAQLIEMFQHQTDREYRIMMGTDVRIPRDPLAMRMREDQIKQSTYPTAISLSYTGSSFCFCLSMLSSCKNEYIIWPKKVKSFCLLYFVFIFYFLKYCYLGYEIRW